MTARQKIEQLTHAWYGYAFFSSVLSLFSDGIPGIFSIIFGAMGLAFSLFLTWFISRRLLAKSSLTRFLLLVITAIVSVAGTYGIGKATLLFVQTWELKMLAAAFFAGVGVYMHARSFRTLVSAPVRAYFD